MARRKITASEMAKFFNEWDTDDDISEEDDETIPVTANVQSDSSQNESYVSDFDLSEHLKRNPYSQTESMKAVGRDGTLLTSVSSGTPGRTSACNILKLPLVSDHPCHHPSLRLMMHGNITSMNPFCDK